MGEVLFWLLSLVIALPAVALLVICGAAFVPERRQHQTGEQALRSPSRIAVLVPAHNESRNVLPTIACMRAQLRTSDRLIVVADNCEDDTAAVAREAGAQVVERNDPTQRGKGYALAFGVNSLRDDPPDVVVVVDADCLVSDGGIQGLGRHCHASGRPVQLANLMDPGPGASLRIRIHAFAQLIKNQVRSEGTQRLASTCQLMGTGMALPWALASTAKLGTGHTAEDMKLGIELASQGHAPMFLPSARVSSAYPVDAQAVKTQKTRWEHGHLATLVEEVPQLVWRAVVSMNPVLLVLAMDLAVPPVALYLMVLSAVCVIFSAGAYWWPSLLPAAGIVWVGLACLAAAILLCWYRLGRGLLSARELGMTPVYALRKIPSYLQFFSVKRSTWVRAKRETDK